MAEVILNTYKVNTGNPGAFFLQMPPMYAKTYGVTKGQRMYAAMKKDRVTFSATENTRNGIPLGTYKVTKSGRYGLKMTLPKLFVNANDITLQSHMTAILTSDGELAYQKETK
jgi:hypothetical protein